MDAATQEIHQQQVEATRAKRRAELVSVAAQLFVGLGPCELYRAEFDADGGKVLRVQADGSYRIVCGVSGRVLVEGPLAELTAEADHGI
jgi:hypothetical protein